MWGAILFRPFSVSSAGSSILLIYRGCTIFNQVASPWPWLLEHFPTATVIGGASFPPLVNEVQEGYWGLRRSVPVCLK